MRTTQNRFRKQALVQTGGIAALSVLAGAVEAAPIYSGVQNNTLSGFGNTLNLDLNGDTTSDISFQSYGIFGNTAFQANAQQINGTTIGSFELDKASYTTRFTDGGTVDAGSLQSVGTSSAVFYSVPVGGAAWNTTTPAGYLGFKLSNGDYGWLYISSLTNGVNSSITIRDWAYESVADTAILAGAGIPAAVPEPSTAALMLGAGVAVALKRRFGKR